MRYYIIAGEASGDLHGSNLIRAILQLQPEAEIRCWGGDKMQAAGATLVKHFQETAYMGFLEVVLNLHKILKNIAFCKENIEEFAPDALIFIDYSGFNLRIAKWARDKNMKTHYYIAPQLWASREKRVEKLRAFIDHIYVILPFEKSFYEEKHGIKVNFVGHPLLDAIEGFHKTPSDKFFERYGLEENKPVVALLPGSRKQEVTKVLTRMLPIVDEFPDYQFAIAGAPSLQRAFYENFTANSAVKLIENDTYQLLMHSHAALVTSGTATLETALFGVPQVVCYRGSWISYQIARRIISLQYISLVNLILEKEVVTELIQGDLKPKNLSGELRKILSGPGREAQLRSLEELRKRLGGPGASRKAARLIVENT